MLDTDSKGLREPARKRRPRGPRSPGARLLGAFLDVAIPPLCLGCRDGSAKRLALCAACLGRLVPRTPFDCVLCGGPAVGCGERCPTCAGRKTALDAIVWAYRYEPPLDAVVRAFKFHRHAFLGAALGDECWDRFGLDVPQVDCVVPVPLHRWRRLFRGYDQARLMAERLARRLRRPVVRALGRIRGGPPQSKLGRRARMAAPRGAFAVRSGRARGVLDGASVLLVDDVVTTGATLEACAAELRAGGALRVVAATVARSQPGRGR